MAQFLNANIAYNENSILLERTYTSKMVLLELGASLPVKNPMCVTVRHDCSAA